MRVTTQQTYVSMTQSFNNLSGDLAHVVEQMATGKQILQPSDDPIAATRITQLNRQQSAIEQYQSNIDSASAGLSQQESILDGVNNLFAAANVAGCALAHADGVLASLLGGEERVEAYNTAHFRYRDLHSVSDELLQLHGEITKDLLGSVEHHDQRPFLFSVLLDHIGYGIIKSLFVSAAGRAASIRSFVHSFPPFYRGQKGR